MRIREVEGIRPRERSMLEKKGIRTLEKAAAMTDKELRKLPLIGKYTVKVIREAQAKAGIALPEAKPTAVAPSKKVAKKTVKKVRPRRAKAAVPAARGSAFHTEAMPDKLFRKAHAVIAYLRAMGIPDTEIERKLDSIMR